MASGPAKTPGFMVSPPVEVKESRDAPSNGRRASGKAG
jgi:hypothetical protein